LSTFFSRASASTSNNISRLISTPSSVTQRLRLNGSVTHL
jgi:hypothetical protein